MKLYTVREFAREKGVSRYLIRKWIKEGKLEGLVENRKSYLIPEDNLSILVHNKPTPITTEDDARREYEKIRESKICKLSVTYDEIKKMFDEGLTIESIATLAGVTKQRISQIYNKCFAFGIDGPQRRLFIVREKTKTKKLLKMRDNEWMIHLEKVLLERGLSLTLLPGNRVEIDGHICKIHRSRKDIGFDGSRRQYYNKIELTRPTLHFSDFIILIMGHREKIIFIIPTEDILKLFKKGERGKVVYLSIDEQGHYRNIGPELDWPKYKDSWHLLEKK